MDRCCRICRNKSCSNHGKNITFLGEGWKCNYIPAPTNADRIRAMSDEELAESCADAVYYGPTRKKVTDRNEAINLWIEWLQKPAE